MKIVVFGDDKRVGVLRDGQIVDATRAAAKYLREHKGERYAVEVAALAVPSDLARFIAAGAAALEGCEMALDHLLGRAQDQQGMLSETIVFAADAVRLHAPHPAGARIACAGANFADHAVAMAAKMRGREAPSLSIEEARAQQRKEGIRGFWKLNRDIAGPDQDVIYPAKAKRFDYEGELAIILGRTGKDIRLADARSYIWGATLLVDWSIRSPREDNPATRFAMTKNFDTGCSMGPCIAVGELDPFDTEIETFVNGERRQRFSTRDMVYDFADYIAHLSEDFTLYPGDVISGGTAAGTAADSSPRLADGSQPPDRFLKPGDTFEVRSAAIGSLRSRVVAKAAA
ncbi:MAG TPA: fumarylacetoacetate hydrolase family protein [Stellaceae bacterium]|nr:fumarylacetoacetate hydrolase family protein [Stellaceae bacterium]